MLRCCVFIAHRAPSQKGVARTRGRKNWQLAVAYNGLSALGYGLLFAGCPEHLLFSRRARCRKSNKCHTIRIPVTNNVGKHSVESTFHGRRSSYIFSKKQLTKQKFYSIINKCSARAQKCASGSVVEHHLAKVGAAGSSPVSRFFFYRR